MAYINGQGNFVSEYSSIFDVGGFAVGATVIVTVIEGGFDFYYPIDSYLVEGETASFTAEEDVSLRFDGEGIIRLAYEQSANTSIYEQPAIVPAAVSSELDDAGEERIHVAPYLEEEEPVEVEGAIEIDMGWFSIVSEG